MRRIAIHLHYKFSGRPERRPFRRRKHDLDPPYRACAPPPIYVPRYIARPVPRLWSGIPVLRRFPRRTFGAGLSWLSYLPVPLRSPGEALRRRWSARSPEVRPRGAQSDVKHAIDAQVLAQQPCRPGQRTSQLPPMVYQWHAEAQHDFSVGGRQAPGTTVTSQLPALWVDRSQACTRSR
jgi:hypothetical protein